MLSEGYRNKRDYQKEYRRVKREVRLTKVLPDQFLNTSAAGPSAAGTSAAGTSAAGKKRRNEEEGSLGVPNRLLVLG